MPKCQNCAYDGFPQEKCPCNTCVNHSNFYSKRNVGFGGKLPPAVKNTVQYPIRNYWQAMRFANRLINSQKHRIRVDDSECWGLPCTGIHIRNHYGEETITWDSFVRLWLHNCECDQPFVTKPFLARRR